MKMPISIHNIQKCLFTVKHTRTGNSSDYFGEICCTVSGVFREG